MTDDTAPVAYVFEVRGVTEDFVGEWQPKVDFDHPDNTYRSYGGFEVRNVRPLYPRPPQEAAGRGKGR